MERMTWPGGLPQRFAAEHDLPAPSRLTHDELVELITTAGVPPPPKPPERMQPFRRRRGPLAG